MKMKRKDWVLVVQMKVDHIVEDFVNLIIAIRINDTEKSIVEIKNRLKSNIKSCLFTVAMDKEP